MKSNSLSWNPTLPTVLLLASEDHNLYTFDIRQLTTPTQIYKDHVAAVTSCEWSPTGEEFSSGGWDRTVRVWKRDEGKSRDVYHTKRMQRITDVTYTPTSTFVLTASDDGNVRIWKANSTDSLGVMDSRERASREYRAKLVEKWGKTSSVRRIESCVLFLSSDNLLSPLVPRLLADSVSLARALHRRRHVPVSIKNASSLKREMLDSRKNKEENRRRHTKAGREKPKAERKKVMLGEDA